MAIVVVDGVVIRTNDPSTLYGDRPAEGTKIGPRRMNYEKVEQSRAIRALLAGIDSVVYAVQFPDGTVKIGCSGNLAQRIRNFRGKGGEVIGFRAGDFDDEKAIHDSLIAYRVRGREYYRPSIEVMAVVNAMRDEWNLPHVAA